MSAALERALAGNLERRRIDRRAVALAGWQSLQRGAERRQGEQRAAVNHWLARYHAALVRGRGELVVNGDPAMIERAVVAFMGQP